MKQLFENYGIELSPELERLLNPTFDSIRIPSKTEAKLKYVSKQDLALIHKDTKTAKELILIILSNFSNTFTLSLQNESNEAVREGYKVLNSAILQKQVNINGKTSNPYKAILDLLIKYNMIEKGRNYKTGERSNEYRLTSTYFGKGIVDYKLKIDVLRQRNFKSEQDNLERVLKCPIATSELLNRRFITFPTQDEAKKHLIKLAKEKKTTRKGKIITYLNKRNRKDFENCVFIEDYLEILEYLQKIVIPIIVSDRGGNRVITAYNFLPRVLRPLCKFNGESLVEADYTCLHPNIAQYLYGGSNIEIITHDKVAQFLNVSRDIAKINHLSFFNHTWENMYHSPLFDYYIHNENKMMENLYEEKTTLGHKETSNKILSFEVELMRKNIEDLNKKGIRVLTAFDAIYCNPQDREIVKEIMNKNAKSFGILSQVN